ncbi:reverse transcriptase [Plakobranchus ocellatus]|uniref:Reverse transcriptase n=1 Tax=Plakobranchus ocellatus TaxID=259542 RepID=A0AAV4AWS2_9GAST|nr:reverse transcriptase [Plakobranchus ocellatus]
MLKRKAGSQWHGSEASQQASVSLQAIDKCGLPGKYKAWFLQCVRVCPNTPVAISSMQISTSTVESIEAKINSFTRKWKEVPTSQKDVATYCPKFSKAQTLPEVNS